MSAYRFMSTHHNTDGSVEPPSADIAIEARDDREAIELSRRISPAYFADDADYAWLVDEAGRFVWSCPVALGRAA